MTTDRGRSLQMRVVTERRSRAPYLPRRTVFLDYTTGRALNEEGRGGQLPAAADVGDLLDRIPEWVQRICVVGAPPQGWSAWGLQLPVDHPRWAASRKGHYLPSGDWPALRFAARDIDREVEIRGAGEWFTGVDSVDTARDAWELLKVAVGRVAPEAIPLSSPGVTGQQIAQWLLPKNKQFLVLSADLRNEIARTSMQGGDQLLLPPSGRKMLGGFSVHDGRVMYGGMLRELGSAAPTGPALLSEEYGTPMPWLDLDLQKGDTPSRFHPGRIKVSATVPADWSHLSIFKLPNPDREASARYLYPREPGETFTVWCDPVEAECAYRAGWDVRVRARILYPQRDGRPLDTFAKRMEEQSKLIEADRDGVGPELARLVSRALRLCVVRLVGTLASRSVRVTRTGALGDLPPGIMEWDTLPTGEVVWTEEVASPAGTWTHPEWASAIWARARIRALDGPCPGDRARRIGALHVPAEHVVGVHADAVYLDHDPEWPDDGAWGRLRRQGKVLGRRKWPTSSRELAELVREATGG